MTVNPRRGNQDKAPWKDLQLPAITGQTVEAQHVYDMHLGETLAPYVTLHPLKAVLPPRSGEYEIPRDKNGVGGIRVGGLEWRMRLRWQIVSGLWDRNRAKANKLSLLEQLDYYGKLSAQLAWQEDPGGRPIRVRVQQFRQTDSRHHARAGCKPSSTTPFSGFPAEAFGGSRLLDGRYQQQRSV